LTKPFTRRQDHDPPPPLHSAAASSLLLRRRGPSLSFKRVPPLTSPLAHCRHRLAHGLFLRHAQGCVGPGQQGLAHPLLQVTPQPRTIPNRMRTALSHALQRPPHIRCLLCLLLPGRLLQGVSSAIFLTCLHFYPPRLIHVARAASRCSAGVDHDERAHAEELSPQQVAQVHCPPAPQPPPPSIASPAPCSLKVALLSWLALIPLIVRRRPPRCTPCLPPLTLAAACPRSPLLLPAPAHPCCCLPPLTLAAACPRSPLLQVFCFRYAMEARCPAALLPALPSSLRCPPHAVRGSGARRHRVAGAPRHLPVLVLLPRHLPHGDRP
jgi:hypothetical protein